MSGLGRIITRKKLCIYAGKPVHGYRRLCEKKGVCSPFPGVTAAKFCGDCKEYTEDPDDIGIGLSSAEIRKLRAEKDPRYQEAIRAYMDGPPEAWPNGWRNWPGVDLVHQEAAAEFCKTIPQYPKGKYVGRGAVISGGGRYLPGVYVTCRMLRYVGWGDPIQVWYIGDRGERDEKYERLLAKYDVEFVDISEVLKVHPHRRLIGFETKLYAMMHCPFEDILFLDSDSYPVQNPTPVFSREDYLAVGGIYFPDSPTTESWTRWKLWGVKRFGPRAGFETGQIFLSKRLAWEPLNLAYWYDQHSEWCYGSCDSTGPGGDYGDKGPHRVAWAAFKRRVVMWHTRYQWYGASYVHMDPDGVPLFVHRATNKFKIGAVSFYTGQVSNRSMYCDSLPLEDIAWAFFDELRESLKRRP